MPNILDNLKFIPIEQLPPLRRQIKWYDLFDSIPEGKAMQLKGNKKETSCIRTSISRYNKTRNEDFMVRTVRIPLTNDEYYIFIFRKSESKLLNTK